MLLAMLAAAFAHPSPQPPPELSASVYRERRERVMKELGGWKLLTADFPRKLEDVEAWVARARK